MTYKEAWNAANEGKIVFRRSRPNEILVPPFGIGSLNTNGFDYRSSNKEDWDASDWDTTSNILTYKAT